MQKEMINRIAEVVYGVTDIDSALTINDETLLVTDSSRTERLRPKGENTIFLSSIEMADMVIGLEDTFGVSLQNETALEKLSAGITIGELAEYMASLNVTAAATQ